METAVIVAHRGLSALYPENTLLAIEQAIAVGAKAIEFDVQMTADKIPVLFHDTSLQRITGQSGKIMETAWQRLQKYHASYPERFAHRYATTPIASLEQTIELFSQHPQVMPCIEIKTESIECFGLKPYINAVIKIAEPVIDHGLFLSFSQEAIELLHGLGIKRTGWVLEKYNSEYRSIAKSLQPQVLICSIKKLPLTGEIFWPGPWEWMIYQTEDPKLVQQYIKYGTHYIETDNVKFIAESLPGLFEE